MRFKNKETGYVEETNYAFIATLLFGFIYFLFKRIWNHALIHFLICFLILPWFIYPFYASDIVRGDYLRKGWVELDSNGNEIDYNSEEEIKKREKSKYGDYAILVIVAILAIAIYFQTS